MSQLSVFESEIQERFPQMQIESVRYARVNPNTISRVSASLLKKKFYWNKDGKCYTSGNVRTENYDLTLKP